MKNCNSTPLCMFYMERRSGCALKNMKLSSLIGCDDHRVYSQDNYKDITYAYDGNRVKKKYQIIDIKKFKRLAREEHTAFQISRAMNIDQSYVSSYAKKHNIKIKRVHREVLDLDNLRELAGKGLSRIEIAEALEVGYCWILKVIKKNKIMVVKKYIRKSKTKRVGRGGRKSKVDYNELKDLYDGGMKVREIATHFNLQSQGAINYHITKLVESGDIIPRGSGWRNDKIKRRV